MNFELIKRLIKFEIIFKLITLMIVDPFISFMLQRYLNSLGSSAVYNQNVLFVFLSLKGIVLLLLFLLFATCYIFFEFSILTYLIVFKDQKLSFKEIIIYSFYQLNLLKNKSFPIVTMYLLVFIPFIHIGLISSLAPQISIPRFIINELQLSAYGYIFVSAFYLICYFLFIMMIFVPLYMIMKKENIITAIKHSITFQKLLTYKEKISLYFPLLLWLFLNHLFSQYAPHYILRNKDFNRYFLKQFLFSSFFRLSFLQYIIFFSMTLIAMIFYYYHLLHIFKSKEEIKIEYQSYEKRETIQYFFNAKQKIQDIFYRYYHKIIDSIFYQKYKRQLKAVFYVFLIISFIFYFDQTPLVHRPWVIGHRGDINACENSQEAIMKADENQADYAEIDVQLSKDKVPVVIHDENLSRLASMNKKVKDMTYDELKSLFVYSRGYKAHISSLEQMIQTAKKTKNKIGLLIELKAADDFKELADKIIEVVEKNHFEDKAIFMSFDLDAVEYMQLQKPEWWIGYCIYGSLGSIDWSLSIKFLAVEENRINTQFLEQARDHYIPVYVWSVEDESKIYQYLNMGVSGIIGNDTNKISTLVRTYNHINQGNYLYKDEKYPQ